LIEELVSSIRLANEGSPSRAVDDGTLLQITEVLSTLASTNAGRKFILVGSSSDQSLNFDHSSADILSSITLFVLRGLQSSAHQHSSVKVLASYLFFLRQIYRTCDGLHALEKYNFHLTLAKTMEDTSWFQSFERNSMTWNEWRTTSIDNLLNFAGTPKGVLLLQKSGSMKPCVSHMFHR
jgi:hypothetical protein